MAAVEGIRSVISVDFVGEAQVRQYIAAMERAGVITDTVARRMGTTLSSAASGATTMGTAVGKLTSQLGGSDRTMKNFVAQFDRLTRAESAPSLDRFNRGLERMQSLAARNITELNKLTEAEKRASAQAFRDVVTVASAQQQLRREATAAIPPVGHFPSRPAAPPVAVDPNASLRNALQIQDIQRQSARDQAAAQAAARESFRRQQTEIQSAARQRMATAGAPAALGGSYSPAERSLQGVLAVQDAQKALAASLTARAAAERAAAVRSSDVAQRPANAGLASLVAGVPGYQAGGAGGGVTLSREAERLKGIIDRLVRSGMSYDQAVTTTQQRVAAMGLASANTEAAFRNVAAAANAEAAASRTAAAGSRIPLSQWQASNRGQMLPQAPYPAGAPAGWRGFTGMGPPVVPPSGGGFYGAAPGGASGGGGMAGQFATGFRGRTDRPYAEQLGQAFKFSVAYGAAYKLLFAVTATFQATLQEAIEYQNAVIDLRIATGQTQEETEKLAGVLAKTSAQAGLGTSEGIKAGARSIGLYGLGEASAADQRVAATTAAQVATQIASANPLRSFEEIQGDVGAISQSFGISPAGAVRIADLDAYLGKKFGVATGSSLQPIAEVGTIANQAGFSMEEALAISANLQSRTGQTASTVGGILSQIFSRGGEGSLSDVGDKYGVDKSGSLRDQIAQLGEIYTTASRDTQQEIAVSFGRGRSQNAAAVLLSDFENIIGVAGEAKREAGGTSKSLFDERMDAMGGQLKVLLGDFQLFAKLLGQSGMLSILGVGVKALQVFFQGLNGFLELFNQLDGGFRAGIAAMALFTLALKSGAAQAAVRNVGVNAMARQSGTLLASGIGGGRQFIPMAPQVITPVQVAGQTSGRALIAAQLAANTGTAVKDVGKLATGAARAGAALGTIINPVTVAIGGLLTIGLIAAAGAKLRDSLNGATDVMEVFQKTPLIERTSSDYADHSAALTSAATTVREAAPSGFVNLLSLNRSDDAPKRIADTLDRSAAWNQKTAESLARMEARGQTPTGAPSLDFTDDDVLNTQLAELTANGGTAAGALRLVRKSLFEVGEVARQAAANFDAKRTADAAGGSVYENLQAGIPSGGLNVIDSMVAGQSDSGVDRQALIDRIGSVTGEDDLATRIKAALDELDIGSAKELRRRSGDVVDLIGPDLASEITAGWEGAADLGTAGTNQIQEMVNEVIKEALVSSTQKSLSAISEMTNLTPASLTSAITALNAGYEGQRASLPQSDLAGQTSSYAAQLADLLKLGRQNDPTPGLVEATTAARRAFVGAKLTELEGLRAAAQADAKSKREVRAIGRRFLAREARIAVANGDMDAMVQLIEVGGTMAQRIIVDALRDSLRVLRAVQDIPAKMQETVNSSPMFRELYGDRVQTPEQTKKVRDTKRQLDRALATAADPDRSDNDFLNPGGALLNKLAEEKKDRDSAAQIAAARAAAGVTPGDAVGVAAAALQQARADLSDAKPGTVEFYNALGAVNQAEFDLAQTHVDVADAAASANAAKLGGGIASAQAQIAAAQRALSQSTAGTAGYYAALQSYYEARDALTEAVAAYQNNLALLNIDATNPLAVARLGLQQAQQKLARDIASGKGKDVIAEDQVAVQSAQAELEQTAFQQRLDKVQTAEDLGRISHAAYIRYLEHESARLERIKHRTYQQQQQLNQIDGLLQEAAKEMQGQFNLGDIKLPTPYQVRRFIEQNVPGAGRADRLAQPQIDQSTTTITIDGADTRKVRHIVQQALSGSNRRANAPRRF